ncbi:TPA: AlpA family phage regulatory protein [Burkholderia cepacia]|nr:AlpA family phage regulatory protein [Burkholderia cepacia]MCA8358227.1 AlpA family transcriptional regulator [Burkholderia cepacia]HDR9759511.1 AlpA family phage regulatory protein [Burkholderia cepacia ATCC 25416]HDV6365802.1 AlpA family phage regulatory protein [Burkholderia cepacia]
MSKDAATQSRILRIKRLKDKTGLSRSTVYNKMNPDSKYYDAEFPKSIRLGDSSVGWRESDVDAWLVTRPQAIKRM